MADIDFNAVRDNHPIADVLASRYGRKIQRGKCKCCLPGHDDKTPSMSVFKHRNGYDYFKCQGCGKEGDVIELVKQVEGTDTVGAIRSLEGGKIPSEDPAAPPREAPAPQVTQDFADIIPTDVPAPRAGVNFKARDEQGRTIGSASPVDVYAYRNAAGQVLCYALRFEWIDKASKEPAKRVVPVRWLKQGGWGWGGFIGDTKRPFLNTDQLAKHPDKPVLLVEGEKCVRYAQVWDDYVVVTWLGGSGQVTKADWGALDGRDVIAWPDNDAGGGKMIHNVQANAQTRSLRVVQIPEGKKKGWDVADALQDAQAKGKTAADVKTWMMANLDGGSNQVQPAAQRQATPVRGYDWVPQDTSLMFTGEGGLVKKSAANARVALLHHPAFKGRFAYDIFDHKVLIDGKDATDHMFWDLQQDCVRHLRIEPHIKDIQAIVAAAAQTNQVSRFADYLQSLQWDGVSRLVPNDQAQTYGLLPTYANVPANQYTSMAGARWMYGLVKRILRPRFRHDYILVLEGDQGFKKTTFFQTLAQVGGRDLYTELSGSLGKDKDDLMKFRGKAIIELSEMSAHRKSDEASFKSFIDRQVDHYRPPYAAEMAEFSRKCVFAGTTNSTSSYLTDPTGNRRIWPALVSGRIDADKIARDTEQLWAEAVARVIADQLEGTNESQNWLTPEEEAIWAGAIKNREDDDPWMGDVLAVINGRDCVNLGEIWGGLQLAVKDRDVRAHTRIKGIMEKLGFRLGATRSDATKRWRKRVRHAVAPAGRA